MDLQPESAENGEDAELTLDATQASPISADGSETSGGFIEPVWEPYQSEKQRDYVRLIVTVGLLLILAWIVVWASIESASWRDHWEQTKEMLQMILPAVTGLIGSVIGFYFGSGVNSSNSNNGSLDDSK
jgi:uncharacterized membrane protein